MLKALFALIAATLFSGAAFYISWAEHPARLRIDDRTALAQWKRSIARAAPMQAGLALITIVLGLWAWWKLGDAGLLVGAALMSVIFLFTLIIVAPVNRRLKSIADDSAGSESRALLIGWGRLHLVRTLLAVASVASFLMAFLWP